MRDVSVKRRPLPVSAVAASLVTLLGGCATYQPHPLDDRSPLLVDPGVIHVEMAKGHGGIDHHEFNPADGLDPIEAGSIAVVNNPDLKAQRVQLNVAGAQAFAAGLLPDPQFSAGIDKPTGHTAGQVNAWSLGPGYDIIPLMTRQARIDAEHQNQEKVRLDLLWQEWQVIQQARSLAVRLNLEEQRLALLQTVLVLYQERYRRSAAALEQGDITLDVNGTDLTALVDTLSQINQLEQTHNQTWHDFDLLLGLDPAARPLIATLPRPAALDARALNARLQQLPGLRPDLLALKAGYRSQEARVRGAILAQFPSLSIGINRASDTSAVKTIGFSVNLALPLFSGNRGAIAIERATREQLRQEYYARLAQAATDVDRLLQLQEILQRQQDNLQIYLPRLKTLVDRASTAYSRGDIEALTFLNMESTWVNKRLEQISLEQSSWENHIALEALLALPGYPETPLTASATNGH